MRRSPGRRLGAWAGLGLGAALASACFDAPQPAVQFSCDPAQAPACPEGYTCEADGCCHLDGSDYDAHVGDCKIGGAGGTVGGGESTETGASASTETSTSASSGGEASTGGSSGGDVTTASGSSDEGSGGSTTGDA